MFLSLLAHAILRVTLGGILFLLGSKHAFKVSKDPLAPKTALVFLGIGEMAIGVLLAIGLATQVAALAAVPLGALVLLFRKRLAPYIPSPAFYVLLIGAALSLVITGAGIFAIDMPI